MHCRHLLRLPNWLQAGQLGSGGGGSPCCAGPPQLYRPQLDWDLFLPSLATDRQWLAAKRGSSSGLAGQLHRGGRNPHHIGPLQLFWLGIESQVDKAGAFAFPLPFLLQQSWGEILYWLPHTLHLAAGG